MTKSVNKLEDIIEIEHQDAKNYGTIIEKVRGSLPLIRPSGVQQKNRSIKRENVK